MPLSTATLENFVLEINTADTTATDSKLLLRSGEEKNSQSKKCKKRLTEVRLQELPSMLLEIGDRNHGGRSPAGVQSAAGVNSQPNSRARKQHSPIQEQRQQQQWTSAGLITSGKQNVRARKGSSADRKQGRCVARTASTDLRHRLNPYQCIIFSNGWQAPATGGGSRNYCYEN